MTRGVHVFFNVAKRFALFQVCFVFLSISVVEDDGIQTRLPASLATQTVAAAQAAAAQATIAQVAALEQLRDKLESGEPPEKKIALPLEEHQRLLQRALQQNLLAMTAQIPMNIRINNQGTDTLTFWALDKYISLIHDQYIQTKSIGKDVHTYFKTN